MTFGRRAWRVALRARPSRRTLSTVSEAAAVDAEAEVVVQVTQAWTIQVDASADDAEAAAVTSYAPSSSAKEERKSRAKA